MPDQQRIAENCADIYCDAFNKLLDANRMLTNEVKRLRESQRWIPVSERLPEYFENVLCTNANELPEDKWVSMCYLRRNGDWYDCRDDACTITPTHWLPLPTALAKGEQP